MPRKKKRSCKSFYDDIQNIILVMIIFVLSLASFLLVNLYAMPDKGEKQPAVMAGEAVNLEMLNASYKRSIRNILNGYLLEESTMEANGQLLDYVQDVRKQIIGLRVPGEQRDFHIKFLSAFNMIEKGLKENSTSDMSEGWMLIEELRKDNDWLKG